MELAIDTSSDIAGVALADHGTVIAEFSWRCRNNHTVEVMPVIDSLIRQVGADYRQLTGISVARGPGAFNGLRVGISIAKGLAIALGLPIVGIGTLELEAYPFAFTGWPVCPVHRAGRGEFAVALFQQTGGVWRQLRPEQLVTFEGLLQIAEGVTVFCGEAVGDVEERLRQSLGQRVIIPDTVARLRRPLVLARLGWFRLASCDSDNVVTLQPIYLRPPHITQPKRGQDVSQ